MLIPKEPPNLLAVIAQFSVFPTPTLHEFKVQHATVYVSILTPIMANNIPLYRHTTILVFIHQLMQICTALFLWELLSTILLSTFRCMSLCVHVCIFLLGSLKK